jgi:hypothetical protein
MGRESPAPRHAPIVASQSPVIGHLLPSPRSPLSQLLPGDEELGVVTANPSVVEPMPPIREWPDPLLVRCQP